MRAVFHAAQAADDADPGTGGAVTVAPRTTPLLPLDDLLAVMREFVNPNVSCSGLDRCLRRHGVGNLRDLKPMAAKPGHKPFKAYEPGYLHLDVPHARSTTVPTH